MILLFFGVVESGVQQSETFTSRNKQFSVWYLANEGFFAGNGDQGWVLPTRNRTVTRGFGAHERALF
jgi:hypothetical protein